MLIDVSSACRHGMRRWLVVTAILLAGCSACAADTLHFCLEDRDIRPWIMRDGKGLNIILLDRVAAQLDLRFVYVRMPWKRCLDALKENEVQGAFGASFKPDRMEYGAYPGGASPDLRKRLNLDRYVVLRQRESKVTWNGAAFSNLVGPVGTQLGYSVADYLRAMGQPVDEGAPGALELVRKLHAGHIQAAALLEGEARALLEEYPRFANALEILPVPLVEKPYYLLLSHRLVAAQPKQAETIWGAIEKIRDSKDYQALEKLSQ